MKRIRTKTITQLIPEFLRDEGLETPLLQHRIIHEGWKKVAGDVIQQHTEKITIFDQTLYVQCNSSVIRQEIMMRRTELIYKLNKFVDSYIINNIIVK